MNDQLNERLQQVLRHFDAESGPLDETEVGCAVKALVPDGETAPAEVRAEVWGMSLAPGVSDGLGWGTYYGPKFRGTRDDGTQVCVPDIEWITPDILAVWEQRAEAARHAVLRGRYADLAWDFSRRVRGKGAGVAFARIAIDSYVEIAERGLCEWETVIIRHYLPRALDLARSIHDPDRVARVRDAVIAYEDRVAEDSKPGLWGFGFDLLVDAKGVTLSPEQHQRLLSGLEARLSRMSDPNDETHFDPRGASLAARPLAAYYRRHGEKEETLRVLRSWVRAYRVRAEGEAGLAGSAHLQEVYEAMHEFGFSDEARTLEAAMGGAQERALGEMKRIEHRMQFPREQFEGHVEDMTRGCIDDVLGRIAVNYISKRKDLDEYIQACLKAAPLTSLITKTIVDHEGRPGAEIRGVGEDVEGRLVDASTFHFQYFGPFLRAVLAKAREKLSPSAADIVNFLAQSPLVEEDDRLLLLSGLERYLADDFVGAIHVLIPRIETLARRIQAISGGPQFRPRTGGGLNVPLLDGILRGEHFVDAVGEDIARHLRVLLTDARGWNLRNGVCHGLMPASEFTKARADWILHALLLLSSLRPGEDASEPEAPAGPDPA